MAADTAYDLKEKDIDWQTGHVLIFIGVRKETVDKAEFLGRLGRHTTPSATKLSRLDGYLVLAAEDYEISYIHWPSFQDMESEFYSESGQSIAQDKATFMGVLMWTAAQEFKGQASENSLYNLRFKP